jgi:hypothetical protein
VGVRRAISVPEIEVITARVWENLERRYPFRRNRPETWRPQRINGLHALDKSVTFEQIGNAKSAGCLTIYLGAAIGSGPPAGVRYWWPSRSRTAMGRSLHELASWPSGFGLSQRIIRTATVHLPAAFVSWRWRDTGRRWIPFARGGSNIRTR